MGLGQNLVLTGFMGTGKTAVGQELALRLGMEFVDTDDLIEGRHGPISRIFEERGEAGFRSIERKVASELGRKKGLVIATGGRMILDPENLRALTKNSRVFCLAATPDEIHERVGADSSRRNRPLLRVDDPMQRIVDLMTERQSAYARFPQVTTSERRPSIVAEEVAQLWESPRTFDVPGPNGGFRYTVGTGILSLVRQIASIEGPMVVITDEAIRDLYADSLGDATVTIVLPPGRGQWNLDTVETLRQRLQEAALDETATAVSLGNGVVCDIVGLTSAHISGIDLVHCPTDLVGMIRTSVGGKVGFGFPFGRDVIGVNRYPKAVVADVATLQRLTWRDMSAGLTEAVKTGLLANGALLEEIERTRWDRPQSGWPGMLAQFQSLVSEAVQTNIAVVEDDSFDDTRQPTVLDLGHSFGVGIEAASGGTMNHGEALALGLVAAARLSYLRGHADLEIVKRVEAVIGRIGLESRVPGHIHPEDILEAMKLGEKGPDSPLRVVLLGDVGSPIIVDEVTEAEMLDALRGMWENGEGQRGL